MDGVIIDLGREREKRDAPDDGLATVVDGVTWLMFTASYMDGNKEFSFHFWARNRADAERHVALMRDGLRCDGQIVAAGTL